MSRNLDRFDIDLLNLVQADARSTAHRLADQVALSPSAIARRLRRLRKEGIIAGDVALLAPDVPQGLLTTIVQIQLDSHTDGADFERLRDRLLARSEVQLFVEISGSFDLLMMVTTRGIDRFNAFADALLAGEPAVRRYETSFVKKRHKLSIAVPLDTHDLS